MQAGVGFRPYLFPRDRFHFTAIDLSHAPLDFFRPCSLDTFIAVTFEAIEKKASKFGAFGIEKFGRLAKKLFDIP